MKAPTCEGMVNRTEPESCADYLRGGGEALPLHRGGNRATVRVCLAILFTIAPFSLGLAFSAPSTHGKVHAVPSELSKDDSKLTMEAVCDERTHPYGVKSKILRKALRTMADMLRSKKLDRILSWLQDEAGVGVVKTVRKHARTIADTLDDLARWEEITMRMVRGQVVGALKSVGVADSVATETAFWIEKFISWTLL